MCAGDKVPLFVVVVFFLCTEKGRFCFLDFFVVLFLSRIYARKDGARSARGTFLKLTYERVVLRARPPVAVSTI